MKMRKSSVRTLRFLFPAGDREASSATDFVQRDSKYTDIRRRIASSGSGPEAAPRLSATCLGLRVPGIAQVTEGCPRIHLRKNWAQLAQPISFAQSGTGLSLTRRNIAPSAKGRLTITAVRLSAATASNRRSASGSARE